MTRMFTAMSRLIFLHWLPEALLSATPHVCPLNNAPPLVHQCSFIQCYHYSSHALASWWSEQYMIWYGPLSCRCKRPIQLHIRVVFLATPWPLSVLPPLAPDHNICPLLSCACNPACTSASSFLPNWCLCQGVSPTSLWTSTNLFFVKTRSKNPWLV